MHCTVASVTALAAAFVVAFCLCPDNHATAEGPDKPAVDKSQSETMQKELDKSAKLPDSRTAKVEAEINNKFVNFDFQGTPLTDVLDYIHQKYLPAAQYVLDQTALKDAGIDPTTTLVTISVRDVHLNTANDLILEPFNLSYYIRDGLCIVTTKEKVDATLETRIYDCREILLADTGQFRSSTIHPQSEGNKQTKVDGGISPAAKDESRTSVDDLIAVVKTSIAPKSWMEAGGTGTLCQYGGLLIVNANREIQHQVADFLDQLSTRLASSPPK